MLASLTDCLIVNRKNKVRLLCPLCGIDVILLTDNESCDIHTCIVLFSKNGSNAKDVIVKLIRNALDKLNWPEFDKVTLLEQICSLCQWHTVEYLKEEDIFTDFKMVPFSTTSFEEFCLWFRDKSNRTNEDNFRFSATMKLRKLYIRHPKHRIILSIIENIHLLNYFL